MLKYMELLADILSKAANANFKYVRGKSSVLG